ncbi:hypothetical protein KPH14_010614 [Odynerus spinipes]|uniref:Uncharacterized protein n=1 Tax=Odynerus spinipes TaxID=1348599 RepID=A0AAD9RUQ9_9HYME|nr:hypothetical protein KPH14_010614 [Odynerus spinipes]
MVQSDRIKCSRRYYCLGYMLPSTKESGRSLPCQLLRSSLFVINEIVLGYYGIASESTLFLHRATKGNVSLQSLQPERFEFAR